MSASKESIESIDATTAAEDESAEDDADDSLTRDNIFHILQCRRRRLVLKYLQEHDTPAKMTDITEHIAAVEHDTTVAALKSQERQRVYIALYQSHLPKLDEEGVIEYQQNRGIVERTERTAAFDRYLDEEPSMREDDTTEHSTTGSADRDHGQEASGRQLSPTYAGGAGFALALLVSIYANLPNTPVPSGVGIAIAAITVFALVATQMSSKFGGSETADE
ncbi:DUF7344 domain-containing protein [Halorussus salinisoli]|uniref:DUF7344 domain-containing protein n=1 Tax=Halorussus salinisoli TaxID=2558242 RepID=UPI0010C163CF|nr:hypothetical protein [Halorussus salinisoli]